jgi:probable selenium-dependent hydroxylase accessory protein YqeC
MKLYEAFNIKLNKKEVISIVGAGGKTTTMFKLAEELKVADKKVLVTTSTAIYYPERRCVDEIIIGSEKEALFRVLYSCNICSGSITVIGREVSREGKLLGIDKDVINSIYAEELFDFIIVEADGAKGKPIKAPDVHEPVIVESTSKTIGVIGIDSIGSEINDYNVHRSGIFCNIVETSMFKKINEEMIFRLIINDKGLFKGTPKQSEKYLILNKVHTQSQKDAVIKIIDLINKSNYVIDKVIAASLINNCICKGDLK